MVVSLMLAATSDPSCPVACLASVAACGPGSSSSKSNANSEPVSTDVSKEKVELKLWDGAGLKTFDDQLIAAFQKKYPNITIKATYDPDNTSQQNGPRVISAADTPDIARITDINSAVRGKHVVNLDEYAKAYGWDLPEVHEEFLGILRFWCGKGVDGFRVDVSHGLAKDLREPLRDRPDPTKQYPQAIDGSDPMWDRNAVHDIYREWRELFNQYEPAKYAIGESWTPFNERVFQYAKQDELGAIFDFSLEKADWNHDAYCASIERTWKCAKTAETSPTWVLGNHDVPRIASRLGVPTGTDIEAWVTSNGTNPPIDPASAARRARAAALIMLGLPGTAFVYQGEELGLPEDFDLLPEELQDPIWERRRYAFKGRDGCRVPLPWTEEKGKAFGFNDSGRAWLPQPDWFADYAESNQENHGDSTLNLYRRAVAIRKRMVKHGADIDLEWLSDDVCGPDGFGWTLPSGMTVLTNFSSTRSIALPEHTAVLLESRCSGTVDRVLPETTVWYRRA